jgi:predicted transcriptional regulator
VSEIGRRFDDHGPVKRQQLEKKDYSATEKGITVLQD